MASSVVGARRSSKALPKAKLAPIKGHGPCWVICCQSDPLQFSAFWQNHYMENHNIYSWYLSTERAQFSTKTPDCTSHNQCFKS